MQQKWLAALGTQPQRLVARALKQAGARQAVAQHLKPGPGRLLESVQRLAQDAHVAGLPKLVALRLTHVDRLVQHPIEEGVGDVHTAQLPLSVGSFAQQRAHGRQARHRRVYVEAVDPGDLSMASCHQPRLEAPEAHVDVDLGLEDPLARQHLGAVRGSAELPCPVGLQRLELLVHGLLPLRPLRAGQRLAHGSGVAEVDRGCHMGKPAAQSLRRRRRLQAR